MQQWMTGNYLLDYQNSDSAFGGMMQLFLVANPTTGSPNVIFLTFNNFANGKNFNQVGVYLKLHGVPEHVKNMINRNTVDMKKVEQLVKLLENSDVKLLSPEDLHLEIIVKVQGKSVFCHYFNNTTYESITSSMALFIILNNSININ